MLDMRLLPRAVGCIVDARGGSRKARRLRWLGSVQLFHYHLVSSKVRLLEARYLGKLGLEGPGIALMDGRPIRASADLSAAPPSVSLRNLRLDLGPARVTGNARYRAPEAGTRGRVDAQLAAQGIDIAALQKAYDDAG